MKPSKEAWKNFYKILAKEAPDIIREMKRTGEWEKRMSEKRKEVSENK